MQTPDIDSPPNTEDLRERRLRRRKRVLVASATLCFAVSVCYWWQSDWLAPVTLVPAWFWLVFACALTARGMSRRHKLRSLAVVTLWVVYTVVLVEEARSLVRIRSRPTAEWKAARDRGHGIRVVSLNCAAADRHAAGEVARWEPDIVLFQESPSRQNLENIARELFGADGESLWGGDTSILARGQIEPGGVDGTSHYVHAHIELTTGLKADVISLRLSPPVFRLDFWSPGFWRDHRDKRIKHRQQILDVIQRIQSIPQSAPLIVGGDFNAPPNDAALAPLRPRLFDTFRKAGHGWGNTGTNSCPLFRVDQIWASRQFRAESVTAQKTIHSDHRMVVCDLILNESEPSEQ